MKKSSLFVALITIVALAGILGLRADAQTNYEIKTETNPVCSAHQSENWQLIRDRSLGVDGRDPRGHKIGPSVAYRRFPPLGMNWYPIDIYKQTLCGQLHHFKFYDKFGEADWNNYIMPSDPYKFIIDDVSVAKPDEIPNCLGNHDCLEVEVNPSKLFRDNQWFMASTDQTTLSGKTVCTYGPWIYEEAHGNHPEIHPAELYWWTSSTQSGAADPSEWFLMQVQDNSDRFNQSKNFTGPEPRPVWWHPWAESPRTGEFKIGFEVSLTGAPQSYSISEVAASGVVTGQDALAKQDSDDGKDHAIVYDGRTVLRVVETQSDGDDLGVRFVDLCRDDTNKRLSGYIAITSKIAKDSQGNAGYLVLKVRKEPIAELTPGPAVAVAATNQAAATGAPATAGPTLTRLEAIRPSLRRVIIAGKPQLVGDFLIESVTVKGQPLSDVSFSKAEMISGNKHQKMSLEEALGTPDAELAAKAGPSQTGRSFKKLEAVPLFADASLLLSSSFGVENLAVPNLGLAPDFFVQTVSAPTESATAWKDLVRAAGGSADGMAPPIKVVKVSEWKLESMPSYAPRRGGKLQREDDSVFSEEINGVLSKRDDKRLKQLFGSNRPFQVEWSFKATNLITGADVPVRVGKGATNEVVVEKVPNSLGVTDIKITFPAQDSHAVYEVVATANMTDSYGSKGTVHQRFWSHFLKLTPGTASEETIISSIAYLAGVPADQLSKASKIDDVGEDETSMRKVSSRRGRMLRLLVMRAIADNVITLDELRDLIKTAKLFGGS
jgi:hypothetical protein